MRGLLAIVSPPDDLLAEFERRAIERGCIVIRADSDALEGVVTLEIDPLGEIRADDVTIADHRMAPERNDG